MAQTTKVFVGSLPQGTKPEELRRLFENYGVVVECDVMNRCGFVHMKNPAMADSAIEALHESEFKGQNIVVEYGRPKERKQGGVGGGGGNQGGGVGPRGGRGNRGILVGFPGKQNTQKFNEETTLQLAGVIMELLGDQQNQLDEISGGNMRGGGGDSGYRRGGGGDSGFRRGGGGGGGGRGGVGGGRGRGGNFQGGNRGGNQNMNGVGPIRNQGFKGDRPTPYSQGMNVGGSVHTNHSGGHGGGRGGGRFNNNQSNAGGGVAENFNNHRGGNFGPKPNANNYAGGNNSWNNDTNFAEDNFSGGFSGNMGNSGGNYGGQQDRRGFALPSNQFQQYGGNGGNQMGGFGGNDVAPYGEDAMFQRRNPSNASGGKGAGNAGGGNFNRGGKSFGRGGGQGGFQNNRGGQGFQQDGGFKRGGPGSNNMNSGDSYQQNFPPLVGGGVGGQGDFGGNNRNHGGQIGRGGGGMNRNAPRQNMPNRRY